MMSLVTSAVGFGVSAIVEPIKLGLQVVDIIDKKFHHSISREYMRSDYSVKRTTGFMNYCSREDDKALNMKGKSDYNGFVKWVRKMYNLTR